MAHILTFSLHALFNLITLHATDKIQTISEKRLALRGHSVCHCNTRQSQGTAA